jgi:hypothetical protein
MGTNCEDSEITSPSPSRISVLRMRLSSWDSSTAKMANPSSIPSFGKMEFDGGEKDLKSEKRQMLRRIETPRTKVHEEKNRALGVTENLQPGVGRGDKNTQKGAGDYLQRRMPPDLF